jgi:hypothetical protein
MLSSPLPCHLVSLKPKYPPQHPILEHPQPLFLPQCQRPSFTPIQNNRYNYSQGKYALVFDLLGDDAVISQKTGCVSLHGCEKLTLAFIFCI